MIAYSAVLGLTWATLEAIYLGERAVRCARLRDRKQVHGGSPSHGIIRDVDRYATRELPVFALIIEPALQAAFLLVQCCGRAVPSA
jgi:hypothetical protein